MQNESPDVRTLLAKQEITEVIYLYCRAMDRVDRALGKTLWHPNGIADYSPHFKGPASEFVDFVSTFHETHLDNHSHQMTNIYIEVDGNTAVSESYYITAHRYRENGQTKEMNTRGRYLDTWSYQNGRWAMDVRTLIEDFSDIRDVVDRDQPRFGRRGPADPSYLLLKKSSRP